jgi:hypothetical protein
MKKTNRKRLELEREVLARLAAIPAANLKHAQGGGVIIIDSLLCSYIGGCSNSCVADSCPGNDL